LKKEVLTNGLIVAAEKTAWRMNHVVTGAGAVGLLGYSIVEYFITPSLWGLFLAFRLGFTLLGVGLMAYSMLSKRGAQTVFYAFWLPVLLFAAIGAGRLPTETGLLLWNIHLCFLMLLIGSLAVSPPRYAWLLPAVAAVSYVACFLIRPGVPFGRMVMNGGFLYLASLLIMFPLMLVRYHLFSENALMHQRISVQNEELVELNAAKDRFFSIIAHDLKGPIGSSARVLNRLIKGNGGNENEELKAAGEAVNRSYSMLDNLLLWARSQRGEISLIPVEFNVNRLFGQVWDEFAAVAQDKRLVLDNRIDPGHSIRADKKTAIVIFRNLLSNAVRYSGAGGRVSVTTEKRDGRVVFEMRDSGPGMDTETADRLFKIDQRQNGSAPDGLKGTGLGLILCKDLAEKNGGAVGVVSVPGQGSSFFLELPSA
jgi:signal transduction histidine kinase